MKKFDEYVAKNYAGLSAHTLFQTLCLQVPKDIAEKWVYVDLWHIFIGETTPELIGITRIITKAIFGNEFIEETDYFRIEFEEFKYCLECGYEYHSASLNYLKLHALDMFLSNVINIDEFKTIVKA